MRNMNGNKDMTDKMSQAYIAAVDGDTPDLWSRVERGFEDEFARMQSERTAAPRKAIHWKRYTGIAAVVLICAIAVPLLMNRDKSSDMPSHDKTFDEEQHVEGMQGITVAPADSDSFMNGADASMQESMEESVEDAPEDSTKASVGETAGTEASQETADMISMVGRCKSIKK